MHVSVFHWLICSIATNLRQHLVQMLEDVLEMLMMMMAIINSSSNSSSITVVVDVAVVVLCYEQNFPES